MTKLLASTIVTIFWSYGAAAEAVIEVGPNFVSGNSSNSVMVLGLYRWHDTWSLGAGYVSPQSIDTCGRNDCMWDIEQQWLVGGEGQYSWRRLRLSFGVYYFDSTSRISSSRINFRSTLGYAFTSNFAVKAAHFSHGGLGSDTTLCNGGWCSTDKQNVGMNSLLLVWHF